MTAPAKYNPVNEVGDLSGKVILLTGGTAGLGKETVVTLAKHNPSHIYFTGRNVKSAEAVMSEIETLETSTKVSFLECDLSSMASVQKGARQFLDASTRLDLLLCNAGIMALPPAMSADGYERQWGTNHMGHAMLIKQLLPTLLHTASQPGSDVRIVITSSDGFRSAPGIAFNKLHTLQDQFMGTALRYCQSKLANLLYARELAHRHPSITSVAIHPGVILTGLVTNTSWWMQALVSMTNIGNTLTVEDGVKNGLWAATADKARIVNGGYYEPVGVVGRTTKASRDDKLAKQLWDWTQKELEAFGG